MLSEYFFYLKNSIFHITKTYFSTFGSISSVSGPVKAITTNFGKIWTVCVFKNLLEILPSFL